VNRKDYWKLALRGAPEWVRYMVYGFLAYAIVNFLVFFMPYAPAGGSGRETPAIVWRGFSGHWMAFYSAAFAILHSALQGETEDRPAWIRTGPIDSQSGWPALSLIMGLPRPCRSCLWSDKGGDSSEAPPSQPLYGGSTNHRGAVISLRA
jgi:hypothetical protein